MVKEWFLHIANAQRVCDYYAGIWLRLISMCACVCARAHSSARGQRSDKQTRTRWKTDLRFKCFNILRACEQTKNNIHANEQAEKVCTVRERAVLARGQSKRNELLSYSLDLLDTIIDCVYMYVSMCDRYIFLVCFCFPFASCSLLCLFRQMSKSIDCDHVHIESDTY